MRMTLLCSYSIKLTLGSVENLVRGEHVFKLVHLLYFQEYLYQFLLLLFDKLENTSDGYRASASSFIIEYP